MLRLRSEAARHVIPTSPQSQFQSTRCFTTIRRRLSARPLPIAIASAPQLSTALRVSMSTDASTDKPKSNTKPLIIDRPAADELASSKPLGRVSRFKLSPESPSSTKIAEKEEPAGNSTKTLVKKPDAKKKASTAVTSNKLNSASFLRPKKWDSKPLSEAKADGNQSSLSPENQRKLQVLEGAVNALKKVLKAQNIDVGQITKPKLEGSTDKKAKYRAPSKPKPVDSSDKKGSIKPATFNATSKSRPKEQKPTVTPSPAASQEAIRASVQSQLPSEIDAGELLSILAAATKETPKSALPPFGRTWPPSKAGQPGGEAKKPFPKSTFGEGKAKVVKRDEVKFGDEVASTVKLKKKSKDKETTVHTLESQNAPTLVPIEKPQPPVPSVAWGLDRVLFNPGVYQIQDPRSRVFNFDPYLSHIMPIQEFDFNALKQYITSSKDSNLITTAREFKKRYTGSTSSMTSMLAHFHYLLSAWRDINPSVTSKNFPVPSLKYTAIMKAPAGIFLHWKDGVYAIDADKEFDTANILSMLGKSMEKLLTLHEDDYERYRRINSDQISEEERNAAEAFHYTGFRSFMMRSQLDAHDPRLPGTGMFDLKTRAVISIRMDAQGFQKGLGYEIRQRFGEWESFEREYYDMIRSAFLKYSLQVRMGRMDGIFVAFHNTQRIFGFQYIPLEEMDLAIHGTDNILLGHKEFEHSLSLLNDLLDRATAKFPEQSLRIHFETRTSEVNPFMYIFVTPVTETQISDVQNAGKAAVEKFERNILGLAGRQTAENVQPEDATSLGPDNEDVEDEEVEVEEAENSDTDAVSDKDNETWESVQSMVENAMDDDELGIGAVREAVEDALEQSGLLDAPSSQEARGYVDALLGALTGGQISISEPTPESVDEISGRVIHEAGVSGNGNTQTSDAESGSEVEAADGCSLATDSVEGDMGSDSIVQDQDTGDAMVDEAEADVTASENQANESQVNDGQHAPAVSEAHETETDGDTPSGNESAILPNEELHREKSDFDEIKPRDETTEGEESITNEDPNVLVQLESETVTTRSDNEESVPETLKLEVTTETSEQKSHHECSEKEEPEKDLQSDESKPDVVATQSMTNLTNLIKKMAQSLDKKLLRETSGDDSSKLRDFERILGNMIAQSRTPQEVSPTNVDSMDRATGTAGESTEVDPDTESTVAEEKPIEKLYKDSEAGQDDSEMGEIYGMVLTIRNKVNDRFVLRPAALKKGDLWDVEYTIEEIASSRVRKLYDSTMNRRKKALQTDPEHRDVEWYQMFGGNLERVTSKGRRYRAQATDTARNSPLHVYGEESPRKYKNVFGNTEVQANRIASEQSKKAKARAKGSSVNSKKK